MTDDFVQLEKQWSDQAEEWDRWIGDHGDSNRRETSDICLWKYIGSVDDQIVLDAGCGNGYLTIQFALETGAKRIFAVDLSSTMIDIAKKNVQRRVENESIRQRIVLNRDSVTELKTIEENSIDLIVSNYVLMDTPQLDSVIEAFQRVLKPNGRVIIVILHPCFDVVPEKDGRNRIFKWSHSYFDETPDLQQWEKFSLNMYHRPLSVYFQTFHRYGLTLIDFDEPKFYSKIHQYDFTCAVLFHLRKMK